MNRSSLAALAVLAALPLTAPAQEPAPSTGRHCLNEPRQKVYADQTLIALVNPLGVEHQAALSLCAPLIESPGLLFDFTNVRFGLSNFLAPVYMHQGAYLAVNPLSVLELRGELMGVALWPFPMDGAAYYPLAGYDAPFSGPDLPAGEGGSAAGLEANLSGTLQVQLPLSGSLSVMALANGTAEYWSVGDEPYYYNCRRDLVTAREDWILKGTGLAMLEYATAGGLKVRGGITDEYTRVPRSGYQANVLAGLAMVIVPKLLRGSDLTVFARPGWYTAHAFRTGFQLIAGAGTTWQLER